MTRHSAHSFDKSISNFLKSLLKYGKDGTEVGFFCKLIEQNASIRIVDPLNEGIKLLKKKHHELISRSDDTFKRIKVPFNEVLQFLRKIFLKRIVNYDVLGDIDLKSRLKEYILKANVIHSSVLEVSGLLFLSIVIKEADLVAKRINDNPEEGNTEIHSEEEEKESGKQRPVDKQERHSQPALSSKDHSRTKNPSNQRPEPEHHDDDSQDYEIKSHKKSAKERSHKPEDQSVENSRMNTPLPKPKNDRSQSQTRNKTDKPEHQQQSKKPFYGVTDILGPDPGRPDPAEVANLKYLKNAEDRIFAIPNPDNTASPVDQRPRGRQEDFDFTIAKKKQPKEKTFNELYQQVAHRKDDQKYIDLIKECEALEKKIAQIDEERLTVPSFQQPLRRHKQKVADSYKERKELTDFMLVMLPRMEETGVDVSEIKEDIASMGQFYSYFEPEVHNFVHKDDLHVVERHTIDEYYPQNHLAGEKRIGKLSSNYARGAVDSPKRATLPARGQESPQANKESFDNAEGVEIPIQDNPDESLMKAAPNAGTLRLAEAQQFGQPLQPAKKKAANPSEGYGFSQQSALKRRRRENEQRQNSKSQDKKPARERDAIQLNDYDSQQEFENIEREVNRENREGEENFEQYIERLAHQGGLEHADDRDSPKDRSRPLGQNLPDRSNKPSSRQFESEENPKGTTPVPHKKSKQKSVFRDEQTGGSSDEDENEKYRRRLLGQAYKSSNSKNNRVEKLNLELQQEDAEVCMHPKDEGRHKSDDEANEEDYEALVEKIKKSEAAERTGAKENQPPEQKKRIKMKTVEAEGTFD